MAQRRMFSLSVVDTDRFLEMPASTQALYFHLGMRADDDGFVASPKKIVVLANCSNDDLKLLFSKGYLIPFESGVVVITDWRKNNLIKSDRYHETEYKEEKRQFLSAFTDTSGNVKLPEISSETQAEPNWNPNGTQMEPQVRIGKYNIYMRTVASDGDAREDEKEEFKEQRLPVETAGGTSGSALVSHATTLEGQKAGASETLGVKTAHGAAHKAYANQSKTLPGFETFYNAYPKKKGRANALKAWKKLCPDEKTLDEILRALEWQKNSDEWRRDGGQYIPYPASWINGRRWEDEPDKPKGGGVKQWRQFE